MPFEYKVPPMGHQVVALRRAWKPKEFAFFHEMGTGKTYASIALADARFQAGKIDAHVVICPTPIKNVWEKEYDFCCSVPFSIWIFESGDHPAVWSFEPQELE